MSFNINDSYRVLDDLEEIKFIFQSMSENIEKFYGPRRNMVAGKRARRENVKIRKILSMMRKKLTKQAEDYKMEK